MKYNIILASALVSTSQIVIADRVQNQFDANETLTATRMNEIRTAVNDNDAKITNKQENINSTCTPLQAIQGIKSNGDVDCIDIPEGGTSDGTTTDYYFISGSDLRSIELTGAIKTRDDLGRALREVDHTNRWNTYDVEGQYGFPVTAGTSYLGTGVRLPNGSTITDMRCYFYDNDFSHGITKFDFNLFERPFKTKSSGTNLMQNGTDDDVHTSGSPTGNSRRFPPDSSSIHESIAKSLSGSSLNLKIDNSKNAYYMRMRFVTTDFYSSGDSTDPSDGITPLKSAIRTYGCRITYTR